MNLTQQQTLTIQHQYPVVFTRELFSRQNPILAEVLRQAGQQRHRILVAIDSGVLAADPSLPERAQAYAQFHANLMELLMPPLVVRGGEICKDDPREVTTLHMLVAKAHLCRQSFVMVIGGGAVLDAIGYATATAHRGLRLLRVPTTTLAQADAGIGVKNAINALGRKNFLGTFAPPFAVFNDFEFLATLPPRELRAGLAEAVKVALVKDAATFAALYEHRLQLGAFQPDAIEVAIHRCAELHLNHIRDGGDPFERRSARPLDFGHWLAHKLEEISHGELRHGEAVAIGIAVDAHYSARVGSISTQDLARIVETLRDVGFTLWHECLRCVDIGVAMQEFQEHIGGPLTLTVLDGIGGQRDVTEIDLGLMRECIATLGSPAHDREERRGSINLSTIGD